MIPAAGSCPPQLVDPHIRNVCPLQQEPPKPLQLFARGPTLYRKCLRALRGSQALQSVEWSRQLKIFEPIPVEKR